MMRQLPNLPEIQSRPLSPSNALKPTRSPFLTVYIWTATLPECVVREACGGQGIG